MKHCSTQNGTHTTMNHNDHSSPGARRGNSYVKITSNFNKCQHLEVNRVPVLLTYFFDNDKNGFLSFLVHLLV